MRAPIIALFAAALLASAACAATLSADSKLESDGSLPDDAAVIATAEGQPTLSPSQARVNSDHARIDQLTQQLNQDTKLRAPRATLKSDKDALKAVTAQLKLDQKSCNADLKASHVKVDPRLLTTTCK
jgi:hypothetical protein